MLNHFVNMLGYSPGGAQHGYLWWLAWLGHNTRTLFSVQDANGPYRPLFIQFSCSQISMLTSATSPFALVGSLLNLAPLRPACPGTSCSAHIGPGELMHTIAPSPKVVTMVLFALSCVGLLLFLWLSFGGTIPFKPQGYRFEASFPNAQQLATQADVRIAGVSVGKVVAKSLDPQGNRTIATIQIDNKFAPIHGDARAILREKTILGETYVEIAPGSQDAPALPDGAMLPARASSPRSSSTRSSMRWTRPPAAPSRSGSSSWRSPSTATPRTSTTCSATCPSSPPTPPTCCGCSTSSTPRSTRLVRNGGTVFSALTQNQSALRNLITSAGATFATTAANNDAARRHRPAAARRSCMQTRATLAGCSRSRSTPIRSSAS